MRKLNAAVTVSGAVCGLFLAGHEAQGQNLFVGDYDSQSVVEISDGTQSTFASGLNYPTGLGFDPSGDLFEVDQFSGNIYEWVGTGNTPITFASGLANPSYMTIDAAGDVYVNADGTTIYEYNPTGTIINTITVPGGGATALAFDRAGNLYIGDIGDGQPNDGSILEIDTLGLQSTFASGLSYPVGMAFNGAGDLFVSGGAGVNTITEIAPNGSESQFASNLNYPNAIAFDLTGNMYVGEENGDDILEFAPSGTESVFNNTIGAPVSLAFEGVTLPVPPPAFIVQIQGGAPEHSLTVLNPPASTVRIQSCTNLAAPQWSTVATFNNASAVTQWTNTSPEFGSCFFRAVSP